MAVYLVIAEDAEKRIVKSFASPDRCRIRDRVWAVRSAKPASIDVMRQLGFSPDNLGWVVRVPEVAAYDDPSIASTVDAWVRNA